MPACCPLADRNELMHPPQDRQRAVYVAIVAGPLTIPYFSPQGRQFPAGQWAGAAGSGAGADARGGA